MINNKIRKRFNVEAADLWNYLYKDVSDLQILSTIEFEDRIQFNRLRKAVRISLDIEPIAGCYLQVGYWRLQWIRFNDLDSKIVCRLIQTNDTSKEIKTFVEQKMNPTRDLLVQLILIRDKKDTLCIKVHHCMMDGGGIIHYMSVLFDIYSKLAVDDSYKPSISAKGCRNFKQISRQLNIDYKLKCIKRTILDNKTKHEVKKTLSFPKLDSNSEKQAIIIRNIEPEMLSLMKDYCKRVDATINDLILACFSSAMFKLLDPVRNLPIQIVFSTDLRSYYLPSKKAETLCNLSGLVTMNVFSKPHETITDIARHIRNKTAAIKKDGIGLMFFPITNLLKLIPISIGLKNFNRQFEKSKEQFTNTGYNRTPPGISNLGIIPKAIFGNLKVTEARVFPPVYHNDYMFVVSTFNDKLTLGVRICDTEKNKKLTEHYFDLIIKELKLAISEV